MEYRRWNIAEINYILNVIAEMVDNVKWIQHVQNCKGNGCHCMLEIVLVVERYAGRCLPWFLDLANDIAMMFEFEEEVDETDLFFQVIKDCPHVQDYKIGNYWVAANLPGKERQIYIKKTNAETTRFINDRMSWAEKIILKQIRNACKYLRLLIAWDINPETMPQWTPHILWHSLEEPYS